MVGGQPLLGEVVLLVMRLSIVGLLYLFMYQVLRVVMHDLRTTVPPTVRNNTPFGKLVLIRPGSTNLRINTEFMLKQNTSIGKDPENDIQLLDEYVSNYHAVIDVDPDTQRLMLKDVGSINNTFLNETLITDPVPLTDGCIIRVGNVDLKWVS